MTWPEAVFYSVLTMSAFFTVIVVVFLIVLAREPQQPRPAIADEIAAAAEASGRALKDRLVARADEPPDEQSRGF